MRGLRRALSYCEDVDHATPFATAFSAEGNELPSCGDSGTEGAKDGLGPPPRGVSLDVGGNCSSQAMGQWDLTKFDMNGDQ